MKATTLTPRENLLKVFQHEQPDWIPLVVGHVESHALRYREDMDPELDKALGKNVIGDDSTRILSEYLGVDLIDTLCGPPVTVKRRNVTVERIERADGWETVYRTPRGELREVYKNLGIASYCVEHLVKSGDDLPALASVFEDEEFVLDDGGVEYYRQRKEKVGDQGLIECFMPGTPLGMMVRVYSGVETLAYLWADHRDGLHRLFEVMEENYMSQFRLCGSLGHDLLVGMDDTSTTCVSPAMFEEFCLGYTDRMADAVHAYGTRYIHHSCGLIRDLLDLYRQTRMDGVDSLNLEPPFGCGDIPTMAEAKDRLGPNITILKPLPMRGPSVDTAERRAEAEEDIGEAFRGVAPGDNIVYQFVGSNMAQRLFVVDQWQEHRRMYA